MAMQKLNLVVIILSCVALGLWFLIQFVGWFSQTFTISAAGSSTITTYTYYTDGYNLYNEINAGGGKIVTNSFQKYSNQTDYSCSDCAASDAKCKAFCGLYSIMGSVYILNWFSLIFIAAELVAIFLALFCLSKSQSPGLKTIYEIMYWILIPSMLVAGGLLFIFDIIAMSKWNECQDANQVFNWKYGSIFVPVMGFLAGAVLLALFCIFVYDYVMYKKESATVVGYKQVLV